MTPFDDMDRTDPSPRRHTEDHFTFLNRVATPYWGRVRALLTEWIGRLPKRHGTEVVARMRSRDHRQFLGAWWETYLFVAFEQVGYGVTVHPQIRGSKRRPDYLIETPAGSVIVEATVISLSNDELARERRRGQIYDMINQLRTSSFLLSLDLITEGAKAPSIRKHLGALQVWLDGLDVGQAQALMQAGGFGLLPTYDIEEKGWVIRIVAMPYVADHPVESISRPIASYPGEAGYLDGRGPILASLRQKAGRYGGFNIPFVIAVMQETGFPDDRGIFHALFGSRRLAIPLDGEGSAHEVLGDDGLWRGPAGIQNTRTAAVLFAQNLHEWNIASKAPELWLNPWASNPLGDLFPWRSHRINVEGGIDTTAPSMQPNELLAIPAGWPGPEGPFEV